MGYGNQLTKEVLAMTEEEGAFSHRDAERRGYRDRMLTQPSRILVIMQRLM